MVNELRVGDEVLTAGGIYGTILELDDDQVTVEIAPETEVRVARRAIAGVTREPEEERRRGAGRAGRRPRRPSRRLTRLGASSKLRSHRTRRTAANLSAILKDPS